VGAKVAIKESAVVSEVASVEDEEEGVAVDSKESHESLQNSP
jgi:hypothetical protein